MSLTTDPRTVTLGPCAISRTSKAKREALIGRHARVTTYEHPEGLVGVIERIDADLAVVRFPDGRWAFAGPVVQLVDPRQDGETSAPGV